MTNDWDLVVVGAGPAGCALAAKVAAAGPRVLLLEKEAEPGLGHDWIVDVERTVFDEAGVPRPSTDALWFEPDRAVMATSALDFELELLPSPLVPVKNGSYARQLAGWAVECGATLKTSCAVVGPLMEKGKVSGVRFESGGGGEDWVSAHLVADSSGLAGVVRRGTPPQWGIAEAVGTADIVLARREVRRLDVDAARLEISRGNLKGGVRVDRAGAFGAYSIETTCIDVERGFVDILVGVRPDSWAATADEEFEGILRRWSFVGERMFGGGGPIPIRRTLDSLVGDGLLVLGDSACQVIPAHGSGAASALMAADIASRTALRCLEEGRYDRQALWDYCHRFQSGRGAVLAYYYVTRKYTDRLEARDIDNVLRSGIILPDDVYTGLEPRPFEPSPRVIVEKLVRGCRHLPLLAGFAAAGLRAKRMMNHYREYPREFSPGALGSWIDRLPRP